MFQENSLDSIFSGDREEEAQEDTYGNHADSIFSGGGEDEAYDEQRKEPAYYAAGADTGNPQA